MEVSGDLKQQFQQLQDQQKKKLERRKQLKEEKGKGDRTSDTASSTAFGINDDLNLKLADPPKSGTIYSEELVQHLNDEIREIKDETGRLYKLLSERDLEVRQLRKKQQDRNFADSTTGGVTNDTAATKIVELSKKIRELTSELESERTRSKQFSKKCFNLENELQNQLANNNNRSKTNNSSPGSKPHILEDIEDRQTVETNLRAVQEKLKQTELKSAEYRNQCQSLRQELKVANKVISQEVGEGVTLQSLLNNSSNWRGRAQQIVTLQRKVNELRSQVDYYGSKDTSARAGTGHNMSVEEEFLGSAASRTSRTAVDDKQKDQLRKMDKERKEAQERMAGELKALEADYDTLKNKMEASKARNKVLSTELKTVKQQTQKLMEKGKHDDELIEALLKQQTQLKNSLEESSVTQKVSSKQQEEAAKQLEMRTQQENNLLEQMRMIVADKETQIKTLEEELRQMNIQRVQLNNANAMFNQEQSANSYHADDAVLPSQNSQDWEGPSSSRPTTANSRPPTVICEVIESFGNQTPVPGSRPGTASQHMSRENTDLSERPSSRKQSARNSARTSARGQRPASAINRPSSAINRPSSAINRPSSASRRSDRGDVEELELQCQEYKSLSQAVTVERDRLSEFVKVLQERINESTQKMADIQSELVSQRRRNAELEKQVGKARVEQNLSAKKIKSRTGASATSLRDSIIEEDRAMHNYEELETSLSIQRDENEALKVALQSTLQSKEEDLRLYGEMIEETKRVFLQGLRQYRGQSATT